MNVPPLIARVISGRPEMLGPLNTVLGVEDLHDVLEVLAVDAHNRRVAAKMNARKD